MQPKQQLLSSLIITPQQRQILIIDDVGYERHSHRIVQNFLHEQGKEDGRIKTLSLSERLQETAYLEHFLYECSKIKNETPVAVLLPTLADFLCYHKVAVLFEFLHELRNCEGIQHSILWASTSHLLHSNVNYLLSAFEYMCDTVVHLMDVQNLKITTRRPGGGILDKLFSYKINKHEFSIQATNSDEKKNESNTSPATQEQGTTFKIELEEEELVARNAMKLPFEKTSDPSESGSGNIVYTPDASDDFDEEDPDDDLCI